MAGGGGTRTEASKELIVAVLQESNLFTDVVGLLAISKAHEKHTNHISQHQLEYTIFHDRISYFAVFLYRKELNYHFLIVLSPFVSFLPAS